MTGERLRIVHAIRAKPPGEIGGADLHVADLAGQQAVHGHEVAVVSLGPAELTGVLRDRKIPHIAVPSMSMLDRARQLSAVIALRTPDVLHTYGYRADLVADAVGRRLFGKAPWSSVLTAHGFIRTSVTTRALTRANEHVLRRADTVVATSAAGAEQLGRRLVLQLYFLS
jgi:L-malate glycosyltransferase